MLILSGFTLAVLSFFVDTIGLSAKAIFGAKQIAGLVIGIAGIIVGSTREVLNVNEWLEAGAHIVTVAPKLLEGMLIHPYSKETVQMFLRYAAKAEAMLEELKVGLPAR